MRILLDTHTALWFFGDYDQLSKIALDAILDQQNEKIVSVTSIWELAIKISLGKLDFDGGTANFIRIVEDNGFSILPVREEHAKLVERLPFHHRDPFDRMLIATAISEGMKLLSVDAIMHEYGIPVLW